MIERCPPLWGELIALHPLREAHAALLFPVLRERELWTYTDGAAPVSEAELQQRYRRLEARKSPDGRCDWLNWVVEERATSTIVGLVQATVCEPHDVAQIAYVIGRAFWGKGLASSAVRTILMFLPTLGVRRFEATVDTENSPSIRLLERQGFEAVDRSDARNLVYVMEHSS